MIQNVLRNLGFVVSVRNAASIDKYTTAQSGQNSVFAVLSCKILQDLVASNQIVVVPNRSIVDNIMLAHDIVRNYHRPNGKARCALTIDIRKAYDYVAWDFMEEIPLGPLIEVVLDSAQLLSRCSFILCSGTSLLQAGLSGKETSGRLDKF